MKQRYAMITIDTEALPKRAAADHVTRLMWGKHANGTAGIGEMCAIGDEFSIKQVFFVDQCGAYDHLDETTEVVRWLDEAGQDVQLHTHPEYLPDSFWAGHGLENRPSYMNQYADDGRADFVIRHFAGLIQQVTGKPLLAHRAGSFRWNASAIRALKTAGIPLSFNNSMCAVHAGQCGFSVPTNLPFCWSNGVIEIPMTEKKILPKVGKPEWWARLTYPESSYFRFRPWWGKLLLDTLSGSPGFAVFLLHSWSLLHWDEHGHAMYKDDERLEGYRKLLARLSKDYDVITSADFLDLQARGRIQLATTVDLALAELSATGGIGG
ncbi:polysaccharide deacetylase [Leeia oryzae]|uniref:polysaccharide deacetylase n=1 Tax=Leeia oryzae TaxID=356662 RepID=UPI0003A61E84|nr:polysaccharide deacetylase [Leeia oryzae]